MRLEAVERKGNKRRRGEEGEEKEGMAVGGGVMGRGDDLLFA